MNMNFSKNLRRIRLASNMTQEQVANVLGVSAQSVSRWECGTTLPDVLMLPKLAQLYCVSIDDLYRENSTAYDNHAQRLFGIFESSLDPDDFIRADLEFRKLLKSEDYTSKDLRLYGILYHHMLYHCIKKATDLFDRIIENGPADDPETYWSTCRQKEYLLFEIGRNEENIKKYLPLVEAGSNEIHEWFCLIQAYAFADENEIALQWAYKAEKRFPENTSLHIYMGDLYRSLKQYDKAFFHWQRAKEQKPDWLDSTYSMGSCYEELGNYEKAYEMYCDIVDNLSRRGFEAEVRYPSELAQKCLDKMKTESGK